MANGSSARNSWLSRYVEEIREYPRLTKAEEHALARRMTGDEPAGAGRDLVLSNLGFVIKIAHEYRATGLAFEDLLNEGNIGLIEAARHFDPGRGTKFITYAVWWIRKSILKALTENAGLVRIPGYQLRKVRIVRSTGHSLSRKLGREADREEISREMRVKVSKIDAILQMNVRGLSLDEKVGRDRETPVSDQMIDRRSVNPEAELIRHEHHNLIRVALRRLTDQEQVVIINRFGLEGGPIFTLKEIGTRIGVSRERVRQLEGKAMRRLRKSVAPTVARSVLQRRERKCTGRHSSTVDAI